MKCSDTQSDIDKIYQLDVLLLTRDRLDSLPLVLMQLGNQKIAPFRLLIRDEGKTPIINDPSIQSALYLLKQKGHKVVYRRGYRHGGYAFVRRQVLLKASAPIIMTLDDDVLLNDPEIIAKMLKDLQRYPSAYCTVDCLHTKFLNLFPHPSLFGAGLGCVLFRRDQIMKAGGFGFYKLYRTMQGRNQVVNICPIMSYLYGPGRCHRYPTHHLELFRERPRRVEFQLNNPVNTFSYIWIKWFHLRMRGEFLFQPYQRVAIQAAHHLLSSQESIPRHSFKPMPSSLTAIHRFLIEKQKPGIFASSQRGQLLPRLLKILIDIRQDIHYPFVYHYLSKKPERHSEIVKWFRTLTKSSSNHHTLSQSARALAQFGDKGDWHYLLNKARQEVSLLKVYMIYCLIRSASQKFLLEAANDWSKSSHWVDRLCALSMALASSKRFPFQAEKIMLSIWKDRDELVQWQAINTMARLKRLQHLESLTKAFHKFDNARQAQLVWLLGRKGTAKHFSLLMSVLDRSRDSRTRACATLSLAKLVHRYQKSDLSRIKNRLVSLADQKRESDPLVRTFTLLGLFYILQPWAWKAILKALKNSSDMVQSEVITILKSANRLDIYFDQKIAGDWRKVKEESLWRLGKETLISGRFDLYQKFFKPPLAKYVFENVIPWCFPDSLPFNLSPKQMSFLFRKIEKGGMYEKLMASWFLGYGIGRKKMLPVLLNYLGSKDFSTRLLASYLLATLQNRQTFQFLVQALKKRDENIKLVALWGLGEMGLPQASQILKRYLNHKNVFLRLAALRGIRPEKSNEKVLTQLSKLIKDKDIRVRFYTVNALEKFYQKEEKAKDLIYTALYDHHAVIRDRAFEVLKTQLSSLHNR